MKCFKDRKERVWEIELNVHAMKRIRAALGVDLVNVITLDRDGAVKIDLVERIANDPCLLVDILWVIVEAQARERGVTDADFGSSLGGDAITGATAAFLDELVDFFPGAKRLFLKKAVEVARKYSTEAETALGRALENPELDRMIAESIASSASSRASSESTPESTPSAS